MKLSNEQNQKENGGAKGSLKDGRKIVEQNCAAFSKVQASI